MLISKCPVCDCDNDSLIKWCHAGCPSGEYIDIEGYVTCKECYKKMDLLYLRFKCGYHENDYNYNLNELNNIINFIKNMDIDDDNFKTKLIYNISERYKKRVQS